MRYDLSNDFDVESARARLEHLISKKTVIELTEKKQRSLSQNAYLHCILSYFGLCTGNTLDYVKRYYYKGCCNRDLFVRERLDKLTGKTVKVLRSSADLTAEEMTTSITRFKNWSSDVAGIYIPSIEDELAVRAMENEVARAKNFL